MVSIVRNVMILHHVVSVAVSENLGDEVACTNRAGISIIYALTAVPIANRIWVARDKLACGTSILAIDMVLLCRPNNCRI
jgi:hypothetical protein